MCSMYLCYYFLPFEKVREEQHQFRGRRRLPMGSLMPTHWLLPIGVHAKLPELGLFACQPRLSNHAMQSLSGPKGGHGATL